MHKVNYSLIPIDSRKSYVEVIIDGLVHSEECTSINEFNEDVLKDQEFLLALQTLELLMCECKPEERVIEDAFEILSEYYEEYSTRECNHLLDIIHKRFSIPGNEYALCDKIVSIRAYLYKRSDDFSMAKFRIEVEAD